MEIFPKDVLLRVGGRTLQRFGVLAVAGAARSLREVPETFARADASTCATYIDRDGIIRLAAANKVRIEWVDLDGDGVRETPGILLEGSRINLITWSDALSNWTSNGTPLVTDAFTTLGQLSLTLLEDDDAGAAENKGLSVIFTGDGVKGILVAVRAPATPSDGNLSRLLIQDTTAGQTRLRLATTWNSDGTLATATASTGTVLATGKLGNAGGFPVYYVYCQTTAITAANTHNAIAYPGGETASNVGKMVIGGVQAENAAFPSSRIKTTGATVTRAADSLTVPFNFGPMDITALARVARPVYADASGDIGSAPGIFTIGTATPIVHMHFNQATRSVQSQIRDGATIQTGLSGALAAGAITACAQYRLLTTAGRTKIDIGAGFTTESPAANAFAAWGNQTLKLGNRTGGDEPLYGVLLDLLIFRGLFTKAEAEAVP